MTDKRTARLLNHVHPMECPRCLRRISWRLVAPGWRGCDQCGWSETFTHVGRHPLRPWKVAR